MHIRSPESCVCHVTCEKGLLGRRFCFKMRDSKKATKTRRVKVKVKRKIRIRIKKHIDPQVKVACLLLCCLHLHHHALCAGALCEGILATSLHHHLHRPHPHCADSASLHPRRHPHPHHHCRGQSENMVFHGGPPSDQVLDLIKADEGSEVLAPKAHARCHRGCFMACQLLFWQAARRTIFNCTAVVPAEVPSGIFTQANQTHSCFPQR